MNIYKLKEMDILFIAIIIISFITYAVWGYFKLSHEKEDLTLEISNIIHNKSGRFLIYHLNNKHLLDSEESLKAIFNTLINDIKFKDFGFTKVVIVSAITNQMEFNFHHNVLMKNDTTFEEYYKNVKDIVYTHYELGYKVNTVDSFKVMVWNMDNSLNLNIKKKKARKSNLRHYSTTAFITPTSKRKSDDKEILKRLSTMDIETIDLKGLQLPICITCAAITSSKDRSFVIDSDLFSKDSDLAIINLFKEYVKHILTNHEDFKTNFVHNLGSFDGYFLYKYLSKIYPIEALSCIIDNQNKFIQISLNVGGKSITWSDSYRVFPISLNELCETFKVDGKISEYDSRFNDISLFENTSLFNEFKKYALQDSISLLNALLKAQNIYYNNYKIDLGTALSTSSLSLKIFRKHFLDKNIPIIKGVQDEFIRAGYYGGATDYYKAKGKNAYYYDVNSLYPYAMKKDMPNKVLARHTDMSNINLTHFFGFCLVEVYCPHQVKRPILPHKYNGETIFPTGKWKGIYFSEELKAVLNCNLGYEIKLISGYSFTKTDFFNSYVDHFYDKKKISNSKAERLIAKMHLNQLYGIFGRRRDILESKNVYTKDLWKYVGKYIIKNIISINDEISTILFINNLNPNIVKEVNTGLIDGDFSSKASFNEIKSNVAIAAAVTAYARIHMIKYKLSDDILYTDTDSIFTTSKLSDFEIGSDLGLMKDEVNGYLITDAIFLGIKQYGYHYTDKNGSKVEASVFAGITRNSLSFKEVEKLLNGETIQKTSENRFYKSFNNLSVSIKPSLLTIKLRNKKPLINNEYIPLNIIDNMALDKKSLIKLLIRRIKSFFKKLKIK